MNVLYLIIPCTLFIVIVFVAAYAWAVRGGQFDDLVTPAHRALLDETEVKNNLITPAAEKGMQP